MRRKLIVVSNRGPVGYDRDLESGERIVRRGAGGLVTALRGLVAHHDVTWIASAMSDEDRAVAVESAGEAIAETARDGSPYRLRLVAHDRDAYHRYYNVFANPTLWFLQHYLWALPATPDFDPALHDAWRRGYVAVNEGFADAVADELEQHPDATVFLHDYHLYLVPARVRARVPGALLSHFVHIPWPATDYWHVLPGPIRQAVYEGLLANDVVGFHTARWRNNFLRACEDVLGAEVDRAAGTVAHAGRQTLVTAHPVAVDPNEFAALAVSDDVLAAERKLEASRPELLVLRVDRSDPSKNVVRGFRAFGLLLERHPELHRRVGKLALLDPSRQDIPEYVDYLAAIERAAAAVNDRFGEAGWQPVDLRVADDFAGSVAAYKQYDALLVNSVFDGLNLVSKEAPLVNRRDGVLLLSENAGSHEELGEWALSVNPFDIAGQAEALYAALTMDDAERARRARAIRERVSGHGLEAWLAAQLADADRVAAARR
jgi:trehalose 6-phosphate synthase